jgi:hypothetical protein
LCTALAFVVIVVASPAEAGGKQHSIGPDVNGGDDEALALVLHRGGSLAAYQVNRRNSYYD